MTLASAAAGRLRQALAPLAAIGLLAAGAPPATAAPVAGGAGTDTSLPATDSQVTESGRGPFSDLKVTVNQTRNLVNQAVSITWTGGRPTRSGSTRFHGNYLQIMQCWGDDDGSVAGNPGPPPEQCVQGASGGAYGGVPLPFPSGSAALDRVISQKAWPNFASSPGHLDERTGLVWRPFRAVNGTVVDVHKDPTFNPQLLGGNYWLNPFFNIFTTNEIPGGLTGSGGKGAELFAVNTGVESSGLGCGQRAEPVAGGDPKIPKCWIVVVPRGTPTEENVGTPFEQDADQLGVATSPLSPEAWKHRIAVPIEFNPVDTPCALTDEQRRIVGTELIAPAVSSWQPKLCSTPGLPPFAYGTVGDASARRQLVNPVPGSPGMVVVSRPLDPLAVTPGNPVVYAPTSLSATVIGFNVERDPKDDADADTRALTGVRVAEINLTPRLVAKLLTQSYREQVTITQAPPYEWVKSNPQHLGLDPEFLEFNPEFKALRIRAGKNFGGLLMPSRNSDAARQVWEYVLADPEAKAWLDGTPDPSGMKVNPVYATAAGANTTGAAFGDPVPDTFPKSDPFCFQGPAQGFDGTIVPPPLCGNDWLPYTQSMRDAARLNRAGDDGARVVADPSARSASAVYKRDVPQLLGTRAILALTDSASAAQYGLQMARLSRAGDNGAGRSFVRPDIAGLTAGAESMAAGDEPAVLEPDPAAVAPAAYPLTALTYAAIAPLGLDAKAREEYASFVDYAAGPGQESGIELGQLPRGYAPLPEALRTQAKDAAKRIRELQAAADTGSDSSPPASPAAPAPTRAASGVLSSTSGSSTASGAQPATTPSPTPGRQTATTPTTTPAPTLFTPVLALAGNRLAMPGLVCIALFSALGALEIAKRPRYVPGARGAPGDRAVSHRQAGTSPREGAMHRWLVERMPPRPARGDGGWRRWRPRGRR